MTGERMRRALGALAAAIVIVGTVGGCAAAGQHADSTATPRVGDCWRVTYGESQTYEDWEGAASVPCTRTHQSYTFAVPQIGKSFSGSWLSSKNAVRKDVDDAAYAACVRQAAIDLPGLQTLGLLRLNYYLPSNALWNGGARWVRCDITRIRVGSVVASPTLAALPPKFSTLEEALNADPKKFDRCEDDVLNNGPDGAQTTYADCTGPADWTFALAITLAGGSRASYPGRATLTATGAKECAAAVTAPGHNLFPEIPTAASWTRFGDRELDCWIDNN